VREVEQLVTQRTGAAPLMVKLLLTDSGRVVFLTLKVGAGQKLVAAHELASELEDELRGQIADIADVVVHTEP
jgi:divalent metal cation (Fe/Co/Zn/Cd) transporter